MFWCARQRTWALGRAVVPTVAIVATMLLAATVRNLETFHGLLRLVWMKVYALFPPILGAVTIMQLAVPGSDARPPAPLPRALRAALAAQAVVAIVVGVLLYASSDSMAASMWPWPLTDFTSKAVGTWLVGTGATCAMVAWLDDRAASPGRALGQLAFAGALLFGLLRFGADVDFGEAGAWLIVAFSLSMLATGGAAAARAWREGRYTPTQGVGGIPVEARVVAPPPAAVAVDVTAATSADPPRMALRS